MCKTQGFRGNCYCVVMIKCFLTSSDNSVCTNSRHGKASDGGYHTAQENNNNPKAWKENVTQIKKQIFILHTQDPTYLVGLLLAMPMYRGWTLTHILVLKCLNT